MTVVKFPYKASRRVHSRRAQAVSPEKASWPDFFERLREVLKRQLAAGQTIDQILDEIVQTCDRSKELQKIASRSRSVDPTAQFLDAELIELGAKFEPLLDQYYVAQRRWSTSSAQAYDATANAQHTIHDNMKPLANAINAASVTSIEGLRIKALVTLWEIEPACKGEPEFSFEDGYPFQQLFIAVAEVCGLKEKIAATGCRLPDIGVAYEDADEDYDDDGEDA
jgi:hypothetical protein